jgi:hypothetical protein
MGMSKIRLARICARSWIKVKGMTQDKALTLAGNILWTFDSPRMDMHDLREIERNYENSQFTS